MEKPNRKHCIIGLGEVGMALVKIFKCDGEDKFKDIEDESWDVDVDD